MRAPIRKGHARLGQKPDPYLTEQKFRELEAKLERMKESRPKLAVEVKRLAEMGDFSENAGYQLAKGRLRGLNQRILDLENHLKAAIIIETSRDNKGVQIGSRVTVEREGRQKVYTILGSTESDPDRNIISYLSPLGASLMGKEEGEEVRVELVAGREISLKILKIEQ